MSAKLINFSFPAQITVAGDTYRPDALGIFDVPDHLVPAFKQRGYVDATAYLKDLQTKTEQAQADQPQPIAVQTVEPQLQNALKTVSTSAPVAKIDTSVNPA